MISTAFAISGALAGIAAVFLVARRGIVDPVMGFNPLLKAFIAVVIGGLGSLPGAVVGGFVLGAALVFLFRDRSAVARQREARAGGQAWQRVNLREPR